MQGEIKEAVAIALAAIFEMNRSGAFNDLLRLIAEKAADLRADLEKRGFSRSEAQQIIVALAGRK
jgi:hypothetical protein